MVGPSKLEGQVQDVSLPEIFRLLKVSGKTGGLRIVQGKRSGEIFFRDGEIYYASSTGTGVPLGERLVKAGKLRQSDLSASLAEQRQAAQAWLQADKGISRGSTPRHPNGRLTFGDDGGVMCRYCEGGDQQTRAAMDSVVFHVYLPACCQHVHGCVATLTK